MEAKASVKYIRCSPRKVRLVVDEVRGKKVNEALSLLQYSMSKKVCPDVEKLIKSAVANIQNKNVNTAVDVDELKVKEIMVDKGPVLKRFKPGAQGRAGRILKRMCNITVTVSN